MVRNMTGTHLLLNMRASISFLNADHTLILAKHAPINVNLDLQD